MKKVRRSFSTRGSISKVIAWCLLLNVGCAGAPPAARRPATTLTPTPATAEACARHYAVAYSDVTAATRALLEGPRYRNTLVTTQLKPIQDAITGHLDPAKIDSLATCKDFAGELRVNVLDLRQALLELAQVPRRDGRGPLVANATLIAIMYARVSDRLRHIIY